MHIYIYIYILTFDNVYLHARQIKGGTVRPDGPEERVVAVPWLLYMYVYMVLYMYVCMFYVCMYVCMYDTHIQIHMKYRNI